jgi:hypothetical protein
MTQAPTPSWPQPGARINAGTNDAEKPRLLGAAADMNIAAFRGRYFAVPQWLGPVDQVDLTHVDDLPPGVLVADTGEALKKEIEYVASWANSRGQFDAQEAQRRRGSDLRAGSALGEPELTMIESGHKIVRAPDGTYFAVRSQDLAHLAGEGVRRAWDQTEWSDINVLLAVSKDGGIEPLGIVNQYLVFVIEDIFYAAPQAIVQSGGQKDVPLPQQPGVVSEKTLPALLHRIGARRVVSERRSEGASSITDRRGPSGGLPQFVRSYFSYNVFEYEGWYYGLPQSLGQIDLTQTDALSLPGVVSDVAQVGVESAIQYRLANETRRET